MKRRRFVAWAAGALALPGVAFAQPSRRLPAPDQAAVRRVAWLSPTRADAGMLFLDALRAGLRERGFAEGRNLAIEAHWGDESLARTGELARQIVAARPEVIVTQGAATLAMQQAGGAIPVVFGYSGDPIQAGLVKSFARPGGNFTGISFLTLELVGKRVEIVRELLPRAKRMAVVANPQHAGDDAERRVSSHAARNFGLSLEYFEARNVPQLEEAMAAIEKSRPDAAMFFPVQSVMFVRSRIAAWSVRNRLPTISGWGEFAASGNLLSYGPSLLDCYGRLAHHAAQVLGGARPADIPAELPTRVELAVNLRTARDIGVTVPRAILLRADRVIE